MHKKVTIIRHGMPDAHFKYPGFKLLKGSQIAEYIRDWNNCELSQENVVPIEIKTVIGESDYFISSTLKRTIDSYRLLGITKIDSFELLNEAQLPYGFFKNVKLPILFWGIMIRMLWVFGLKTNSESYKEFKERIKKAYDYISSLSTKFNHIVIIGHGFTNLQLKKELRRNQWTFTNNYGGHNYWSLDNFEKDC